MTVSTSAIQASRLRGIDAARQGVERGNPANMVLLARSLAHEVVEHMDVQELSEGGCSEVAANWAQAATSLNRDDAVQSTIELIISRARMDAATGLRNLGFDAWNDLVREVLGIEPGAYAEGVDMLAEMVAEQADQLMSARALEALPEHALVEMSFIPDWDGKDLDAAVGGSGLRFSSRHTGLRTVECNEAFAQMLRFFNVSIAELMEAVKNLRPDEYDSFVDRVVRMKGWQSLSRVDVGRPSLMTAEGLITVLENASQYAIPNISFQVRLKSLLACDPARPIQLDAAENRYHVGCHDGFINGAGYMDTFQASGPVSIDLSKGVLISEDRWNSSLHSVYWHVKSAYRVSASQSSDDQLDLPRLLQRVAA